METDGEDWWVDENGECYTDADAAMAEAEALVELEAEAAGERACKISAFVTTPGGKVIHKQRLVAMLNQCPTMSNDRLKRIAQGTQHGDKCAPTAESMAGGKSNAIELGSRCVCEVPREGREDIPHLGWSRSKNGTEGG